MVYVVDPLDNNVPPIEALYQSMVDPTTGIAEMVTIPVPHLETSEASGSGGTALIVAITARREAEVQPVVVSLVCT